MAACWSHQPLPVPLPAWGRCRPSLWLGGMVGLCGQRSEGWLPLAKVEEIPDPMPTTALGLFSARAVRSRDWDPVPCPWRRACYCFIRKIFGVWAFQLTLKSWVRTKLMGTIWCREGAVRGWPWPSEIVEPLCQGAGVAACPQHGGKRGRERQLKRAPMGVGWGWWKPPRAWASLLGPGASRCWAVLVSLGWGRQPALGGVLGCVYISTLSRQPVIFFLLLRHWCSLQPLIFQSHRGANLVPAGLPGLFFFAIKYCLL